MADNLEPSAEEDVEVTANEEEEILGYFNREVAEKKKEGEREEQFVATKKQSKKSDHHFQHGRQFGAVEVTANEEEEILRYFNTEVAEKKKEGSKADKVSIVLVGLQS